jgi:hypothetical protein
MSFQAYERAVDQLLSRAHGKIRSVFDLPTRDVQQAFYSGVSAEAFVAGLDAAASSKGGAEEKSPSSDGTLELL